MMDRPPGTRLREAVGEDRYDGGRVRLSGAAPSPENVSYLSKANSTRQMMEE
ncbi:MAG: hypothetical protein WBB22_11270 [Anaerolineae bacterium]